MDTRVFSIEAGKSYDLTNNPLDHEHVTLHMKNNPEKFEIINLFAPSDLFWPELGLTLDEIGDYKLIDDIKNLYEKDPYFGCLETKDLENNEELLDLNRNVSEKEIFEEFSCHKS